MKYYNHNSEIDLRKKKKEFSWFEWEDPIMAHVVTIETFDVVSNQPVKMAYMAFNDDIIYLHSTDCIGEYKILESLDGFKDSNKYVIYEIFDPVQSRKEIHVRER